MFDETELPPPSEFCSTSIKKEINQDDYYHTQNNWDTFDLKTLGKYHDIYVKTDVLQLADVFQNFLEVCKRQYNLDCAHVKTASRHAWQASLKMIEQALELLTDIYTHLFIENCIRDGEFVMSQLLAAANSKYLRYYNNEEASRYTLCWDVNNACG